MKSKFKSKKTLSLNCDIKLPGENYAWKVLGLVAEDLKQYLNSDDFDLVKLIVRNRDYHAYKILTEDWGLQCIASSCMNLQELKAKYMLSALLKKFRFSGNVELQRKNALEKFFSAEESCRAYNVENYIKLIAPYSDSCTEMFTYARQFLQKVLGEQLPSYRMLTEWSRHGPGANLDTCKGGTSLYDKYTNWPYSCTVDAFRYARFAISSDARWFGALQDSYRERFGIPKHSLLNMEVFWTRVLKIVDGNRITFVPKDAENERTITIEPAMNLYLQLGVDGFIRRRLMRFGINLNSQLKNQTLARRGSMQTDEKSFSTIDLSAASDCMSLKLLEILLPSEWYQYLCCLRSPIGEFADGSVVKYEKISSMGNGFTFVLESAVFAAAVYAVQKHLSGRYDPSICAVYGDDLIITGNMASTLVAMLEKFGFKINVEKSFFKGPIRESCGTDWFKGTPIRPVFLTSLPVDVSGLFVDHNRLKRILSLRFGVEYPKVCESLIKWIPEKFNNLLGPYSDEDFSSYRHVAGPQGPYKHGLWKYERLTVEPVEQPAKVFLFRKLMHDLRPHPIFYNKWETGNRGGSRFTSTKRNALRCVRTYSRTSHWCDDYSEG